MKLKLFILSFSLVILSAIIYFELNYISFDSHTNQKQEPTLINTKVPDFNFTVINQKGKSRLSTNIYNLKADKTLIHFWASWCHVCTSEFNAMIKYAKKHPNVNILAVAIDLEKEPLYKYLKTLKSIHAVKNLLLIWDEDRSISLGLFNSNIVPETYVINNNYEITDKIVGKIDWNKDI